MIQAIHKDENIEVTMKGPLPVLLAELECIGHDIFNACVERYGTNIAKGMFEMCIYNMQYRQDTREAEKASKKNVIDLTKILEDKE